MGLFTSLLKTAVSVAVLPVAVAVDVLDTLDGDTQKSKTIETLHSAKDNALDVIDKII